MQRKRDVTPIPSAFFPPRRERFFFWWSWIVRHQQFSTLSRGPFCSHIHHFHFSPHSFGTLVIYFKASRRAPPACGTVLVKAQPNTVCRTENLNLCCLRSLCFGSFCFGKPCSITSITICTYVRGKIFLVQPFPKTKQTNPNLEGFVWYLCASLPKLHFQS